MQAILLLGGSGTRLRPLTFTKPKSLLTINGITILEHIIRLAKSQGVDSFVLTVDALTNHIYHFLGNGEKLGVKIEYVIEDKPLGTAGAILNALDLLGDRFFVFNGDILSPVDLSQMYNRHLGKGADATIALTYADDPTPFGMIERDDSNVAITRWIEKPRRDEITTNWVNAGTYILERAMLLDFPRGIPFSFEYQLFPQSLNNARLLIGFEVEGYWMDIGTPEKYKNAQYYFIDKIIEGQDPATEIQPGVLSMGNVEIGPDVIISPPVLLCDNVKLTGGSQIIGPTIIGKNVYVAERAIVERSVLNSDIRIGSGTKITSAIIGSNTTIGENCVIQTDAVVADYVTIGQCSKIREGERIGPGSIISSVD